MSFLCFSVVSQFFQWVGGGEIDIHCIYSWSSFVKPDIKGTKSTDTEVVWCVPEEITPLELHKPFFLLPDVWQWQKSVASNECVKTSSKLEKKEKSISAVKLCCQPGWCRQVIYKLLLMLLNLLLTDGFFCGIWMQVIVSWKSTISIINSNKS